MFAGFPDRPVAIQQFNPRTLNVQVTPTALNPDPSLVSSYIDGFIVSVPAGAAGSVWIGGPAVTIANGLELGPGSLTNFAIDQGGRQLYELQKVILQLAEAANCSVELPTMLPFVVWDQSQIFFIAAAITPIAVCAFRNPFV